MKKKILTTLAILLLIGFAFIFDKTSPSGDIENYKDYYTNDAAQPVGNQVKITFFGVSTLLFDDGETQLLIDGFFSRPSIWRTLFTKIESDTALINNLVTTYKMDRVKGIFATHSHYDHAFDVAYTAKKTHATLYGSSSTLNIGRGGGLKEEQLQEFHAYERLQLGKFTIQVLPSKHSPNNALKDDGVAIEKPLQQPTKMNNYTEGGSYDFYIQHNGHTMYVKPSPNYVEGMLDTLKTEALFIGIATIGKQDSAWQQQFYKQTVGKLTPKVVVPLHWDDFLHPISENLVMLPRFANDSPKDFDFMLAKTKVDKIDFKILQGTKSVVLFK